MCDPLTLIGGALSLFGSKGSKPPPVPALDVEAPNEDTGADVILGSDQDKDAEADKKKSTSTSKVTAGSSLSTSKATGINIL